MSKNFFTLVKLDLLAAKNRDPAYRTLFDIIFSYSGFHAIVGYRISNLFWNLHLKFIARFISNLFRILTSIEIHPASKIGEGFFIDHGVGLVIGETSEVGNNVTMYQQVTLGGISPSIDSDKQINLKRHPTIADNVILGSGAHVLGPVKIGKNSRIGANAVVLNDVPSNQTFIGIPARKVRNKRELNQFTAYGITDGKIDDPNKKSILGIVNECHELALKLRKLEKDIKKLKTKSNQSTNFTEINPKIVAKEPKK